MQFEILLKILPIPPYSLEPNLKNGGTIEIQSEILNKLN